VFLSPRDISDFDESQTPGQDNIVNKADLNIQNHGWMKRQSGIIHAFERMIITSVKNNNNISSTSTNTKLSSTTSTTKNMNLAAVTPQEDDNFSPSLANEEKKLTPEQENNLLPSLMGQGQKLSLRENILQLIHNLQKFRKGNKTGLDADENLCNRLPYLGNEVAQIVSCKRSKQMMLHSIYGSNSQTWVHIGS
jgi:hypothetical protein